MDSYLAFGDASGRMLREIKTIPFIAGKDANETAQPCAF
jgi:hypothetical protein